jgi:hypothetical protein
MTNLTFFKALQVDADYDDEIELEGVDPANVIEQMIEDCEGPDEEVWKPLIHALKLALLICEAGMICETGRGGTAVDKMIDEMAAIAGCILRGGRADYVLPEGLVVSAQERARLETIHGPRLAPTGSLN